MTNVATIPIQASQAVDTRYTQDVIPVLDTGKFEHMQRIACVMAKTSTIPESLCIGEDKKRLPEDTIIANCFRIVNQAVRWGMDPFAVADCASIIHGKLMWEGKIVAAVIDAKLGVKLNYEFDEKSGQELGVTVHATLPGETQRREIFGRVKDWHRGPKSPWASEGAWKRQLRYMGNREWARAHAPAVMLGVYVDDELDDIATRDVPAGMRALRMKDVTPKSEPLLIPDIPDVAPAQQTVVPEPDQDTVADPDSVLTKIADDIALCTSTEELAEVADVNADLVARLPKSYKDKAAKMFKEAAE
jgi:hypothetical protein